MIIIDKQSRIPVYEQLIDSIKQEILNGFLTEEETIPSVRALSMDLSINPNTIQKAYNELERIGITQSVPGVGRYVSKEALSIIKKGMEDNSEILKEAIVNLKLAGLSLEEIIDKIKLYYGGESDD